EARAQLMAGEADERLILLVAHLVDAPAQGGAAAPGEERLQTAAVLSLEHAPAALGEEPFEVSGADAGHHPVQALAVQVYDPEQILESGEGRVEDRLPDVTLIKLSIADQRDEAPQRLRLVLRPVGRAEMGGAVAPGKGGE